MFGFLRGWYLVARLDHACLSEPISLDPSGSTDFTNGRAFVLEKVFLEHMAYRRLFLFKRSNKSMSRRMSKDKALLDSFVRQNPPLVEELTMVDAIGVRRAAALRFNGTEIIVRATGLGHIYAAPTNGLEEFVKTYKATWGIILAFIGWAWLPILKPVIKILFSMWGLKF